MATKRLEKKMAAKAAGSSKTTKAAPVKEKVADINKEIPKEAEAVKEAEAPKAVEEKKAEVKEAPKAEAKTETKTEAKTETKTETKATAKTEAKEEAKTEAAKAKTTKTAAKTTAKKAAPAAEKKVPAYETESIIQYQHIEVSEKALIEKVKDIWTKGMGKTERSLKEIKLYIKPEEYSAYYVINGKEKGRIDL